MSVTIKYKGNQIASMDESGTKTLKTSGKYCEGDFAVDYVADGGGGVVSAVNGKIFEVTLASNSPTGWQTLISGDSDILAHKDDSSLIAFLQYMSGGKSGVGYIPFAMCAATPFTADSKSSLYLYQKNTDATAASSSDKNLRVKTAARGVIHITDTGDVMYYVDSSSYPLIAGRYLITVLW